MGKTENPSDYFEKSGRVWFPDFMEKVEAAKRRYAKYPGTFDSLLTYFQGGMTRAAFARAFPGGEAPEKMLRRDREEYHQVKALCRAYQDGALTDRELDERLLRTFRRRPEENVFAPPAEAWEEIRKLMDRLAEKQECLSVHFDGIGWNAFLSGTVTRSDYARGYVSMGVVDHLAQYLTYGVGKEEFAEKYPEEITVCRELLTLCLEYQKGNCPDAEMDMQFLALAKRFCRDTQ